jgi:8-oxo-dGTP pyrophosphatase MutT (NUDIX family)
MAPKGGRLEDDLLLTPAQCLGLFVAAIREVFEEAGVLLARRGEGRPLSFEEPETARRFDSHRRQLHEGTLSMTEMARREDLVYSLDRLQYFAHWITPTVEKRRFNTRFFMARSPPGQEPLHDKTETVDSAWLTPEQALEAYNAGEIQLAPPTMRTLEEMLGAPSSEALISAATRSRPVTILPRFETIDGEMTILLPGDPLYPCRDGVEGPTRVVMSQGRWWSRSG